jgi:hypothetical protein
VTRAVRHTGGQAIGLALALLTAGPTVRLSAQDSLPPGYGTLRRDDIAVHFSTDQLDIQVLPLGESVTRLLAPDTYGSLRGLVASRRAAIDSVAQLAGEVRPTLMLVTFQGLTPGARFSPEDVNLGSRGQLYRPIGIVPISPRWSSYQLDAHDQVVAIYLFDEAVSLGQDLIVSYQSMSSNHWARASQALDQERARVRARAAAGPPRPN